MHKEYTLAPKGKEAPARLYIRKPGKAPHESWCNSWDRNKVATSFALVPTWELRRQAPTPLPQPGLGLQSQEPLQGISSPKSLAMRLVTLVLQHLSQKRWADCKQRKKPEAPRGEGTERQEAEGAYFRSGSLPMTSALGSCFLSSRSLVLCVSQCVSGSYTKSSVRETLGDEGIRFLPSRSFQTGRGEKGIKDAENDLRTL